MKPNQLSVIARLFLAAILLSNETLAVADACATANAGLCANNGASCDLIHDVNGKAQEVCRWSSSSSAAACGNTAGIWTTADSKYGRNHPDAVPSGSAGACISEVRNIQRKMTNALVTMGQVHVFENSSLSSLPIEFAVSDYSVPPLFRQGYETIGYWDVDDRKGNSNKYTKSFSNLAFGSVRDMLGVLNQKISGRGTHEFSKKIDGIEKIGISVTMSGGYFASLGVDRQNLHRISDLRITASNDPPFAIANRYLGLDLSNVKEEFHNKKVLIEPNAGPNKTIYVVGIWDVDGGGGYGNDSSFGTYGMTMYATLSTGNSERKLVDLKLVASHKSGPTIQDGYDVVGYWDVDSGGSQGSDGSTGSHMMTMLAKWSK